MRGIRLENLMLGAVLVFVAIIKFHIIRAVKVVACNRPWIFPLPPTPVRFDLFANCKRHRAVLGLAQVSHGLLLEITLLGSGFLKVERRDAVYVAIQALFLKIHTYNEPLPLQSTQCSVVFPSKLAQCANFPVGADIDLGRHDRFLDFFAGTFCRFAFVTPTVVLSVTIATLALSIGRSSVATSGACCSLRLSWLHLARLDLPRLNLAWLDLPRLNLAWLGQPWLSWLCTWLDETTSAK